MISPARRQARAARAQIEEILDQMGRPWPWHPGLSRLLDLWLLAGEAA